MSNFSCRFITRGTNDRNAKLGQKWSGRGHLTYFRNFGTPYIYREWLELETSNLVCRFITIGTNERYAKLGQKGSGMGHVT